MNHVVSLFYPYEGKGPSVPRTQEDLQTSFLLVGKGQWGETTASEKERLGEGRPVAKGSQVLATNF